MTSFYRVYGLETVSLRYFNVFGPYQDPGAPCIRGAGYIYFEDAAGRGVL